MRKSQYVEQKEKDELEIFNTEMTRRSMQNLYDQHNGDLAGLLKSYALSEKEMEILKEVDAEAEHQAELDQAFLRGFSGGK